MDAFVRDLLENAPDGITVSEPTINSKGHTIIQWWACSRFGISLRVEPGCLWAEGLELVKDQSNWGWGVVGKPRDLEGREQVIGFLREIIAEYRVTVQF